MRRLIPVLAMLVLPAAGASRFETGVVFPTPPHNRPNYRIPALLQTSDGSLLVFAERRNDGPGDIGDHDIVLRRSRDLGRTWNAEQVIVDDGDRTCADITVGMDRRTGTIRLFFLRDKKRFMLMTSDDEGTTWSTPVSIHEQVTRPDWDRIGADAAPAEKEKENANG